MILIEQTRKEVGQMTEKENQHKMTVGKIDTYRGCFVYAN
jgi:hypothetical protein